MKTSIVILNLQRFMDVAEGDEDLTMEAAQSGLGTGGGDVPSAHVNLVTLSQPRLLVLLSTMLSERAKGKQRATDSAPLPQEDSSRARELTVRFTEGEPDLILQIAENETVRDVKANVCSVLTRPPNHSFDLRCLSLD